MFHPALRTVAYALTLLATANVACSVASPEGPDPALQAGGKASDDLGPWVEMADPLLLALTFSNDECPAELVRVPRATELRASSKVEGILVTRRRKGETSTVQARAYDLGTAGCAVLERLPAEGVAQPSYDGPAPGFQLAGLNMMTFGDQLALVFMGVVAVGWAVNEHVVPAVQQLFVAIPAPEDPDYAKLEVLIEQYAHDPPIFSLGAHVEGEDILFIVQTQPLPDGTPTALAQYNSEVVEQRRRRLVRDRNAAMYQSESGHPLLLPVGDGLPTNGDGPMRIVYRYADGAVLLASASDSPEGSLLISGSAAEDGNRACLCTSEHAKCEADQFPVGRDIYAAHLCRELAASRARDRGLPNICHNFVAWVCKFN